jgi:uncharacterized membrane protein YdjX (TVP38/TMEM64 family)
VILAFVAEHRLLAIVAFVGLYIAVAALSIPGAALLTLSGGFLFGAPLGTVVSVVGATTGATLIFLLARSALGNPLLKRAGPRVCELARGFREQAFSYLLFLRLVPAFPFFLVNLVPAFAGARLTTFIAATVLGMIPAAVVYSLAGEGLDGIIDMQLRMREACLARGGGDCPLTFDPRDVLTPQLITALIGLACLALLPVVLRGWRARRRTSG